MSDVIITADPRPGEIWVNTRGQHEGMVAEISRVTDTKVYIKPRGKAGANWGSTKSKGVGEYPIPRDTFMASYKRRADLEVPEVVGSASYRRMVDHRPPPTPASTKIRKAPTGPGLSTPPATGLVKQDTAQANVSFEWIYPDGAKAWIDRGNIVNRKYNDRRADRLAAVIRNGRWVSETTDMIALDPEGRVMNGQHRLMAIYKAQIAVQAWVMRGLDPSAMKVLDTGAKRSVADIVGMAGYKSSMGLSAAVKNLIFWEKYQNPNVATREAEALITADTTIEYLDTHPEVNEYFKLGNAVSTTGKLPGGTGIWGFLFVLFCRQDEEQALVFAEQLKWGENLGRKAPALVLRNRARDAVANSRTRVGIEELSAIAIKAWNAFRQGREVGQLAYRRGGSNPEQFPVLWEPAPKRGRGRPKATAG